jgi:hypothetical protein
MVPTLIEATTIEIILERASSYADTSLSSKGRFFGLSDSKSKKATTLIESWPLAVEPNAFSPSQPVNKNKQAQPDHVNEVPVPCRRLKRKVMLCGKVAPDAAE